MKRTESYSKRAYLITLLELETIEEHRGFAPTLRPEPYALHHKMDGINRSLLKILYFYYLNFASDVAVGS